MNTVVMPGDVLYRDKDWLIDHVGICIAPGQILHNVPGRRLTLVSTGVFAEGSSLKVTRNEGINLVKLRERAYRLLTHPKPYHFLLNNCEHLVSYLLNGDRKSDQVVAALSGAIAGSMMCPSTSNRERLLFIAAGAAMGIAGWNALRKYSFEFKDLKQQATSWK